jgi:CheY-like chemotaxis protein
MSTAPSQSILVVDDSEICREAVRATLEERGYRVVTVDGPIGFCSILSRERPDLVLLDVLMPALRGDQLVVITRQFRLHRCPLVLFSSLPRDELRRLAGVCGAAGYITKTEDKGALVRAVESFLRR